MIQDDRNAISRRQRPALRAAAMCCFSQHVDDPAATSEIRWTKSPQPLGVHVDAMRTRGLVNGDQPVFRQYAIGTLTNEDIEVQLATTTAA